MEATALEWRGGRSRAANRGGATIPPVGGPATQRARIAEGIGVVGQRVN